MKVRKGAGSEQTLHAPLIISDAGVFNTFERLVPSSAALRVPTDSEHIQHSTHGVGAMSVYIGLEGDADELNLKATNAWAFTSNSLDSEYDRYISLPASKAGTEDIPLLFVSFPSCKDPTWKQRFPGKSTCEIVTLAPYEWFEQVRHYASNATRISIDPRYSRSNYPHSMSLENSLYYYFTL